MSRLSRYPPPYVSRSGGAARPASLPAPAFLGESIGSEPQTHPTAVRLVGEDIRIFAILAQNVVDRLDSWMGGSASPFIGKA